MLSLKASKRSSRPSFCRCPPLPRSTLRSRLRTEASCCRTEAVSPRKAGKSRWRGGGLGTRRISRAGHRLPRARRMGLDRSPATTGSSTTYWLRSAILVRPARRQRSEEHTSELQSLAYLVCRLLLEKKKKRLNIVIKPRRYADYVDSRTLK